MADFFIGEALQGKGNELAHIDLMIGDKDGPIGHAFANGMTQLSQGHTPLLALIKPNLLPHPRTLIVPKVTIDNLDQAGKIFGPAQMAVAKAVADAAAEGDIPKAKLYDYVVIVSVYIHPKAEDESKIFYYNYGATRLAIKRALSEYPPMKKLIAEDRARHPVMKFRPQTLWNPPYVQVALDVGSLSAAVRIVEALPRSDRMIIEIGTPYIKKYGIEETISRMRKIKPGAYIIADMKTMDVGRAEVNAAADATANAVVVSGIAPKATVTEFIRACKKRGVHAWVDSLNTNQANLITLLEGLPEKPKVVILHRGIDQEDAGTKKEGTSASRSVWGDIKKIKKITGGLAAVAGGLKPGKPLQDALKAGADIVIVGRYIYQSSDPHRAAMRFLDDMEIEADTMRLFDKLDY